jgi:hypothetical protein
MPETRIASRTINMALKSIGSINVSWQTVAEFSQQTSTPIALQD